MSILSKDEGSLKVRPAGRLPAPSESEEDGPAATRSESGRGRGRAAPHFFRRALPAALLLGALIPGACRSPVSLEVPQVIRTLPHDPGAYTQGLVFHEGRFYESTGQYGSSTLREVDAESGEVLRSVSLDDDYFGEGLARVGSRLIQLTWRENVAFVYDLATFEVVDTLAYEGRGWGLCHDGASIFMTNGGSTLYRRDPGTFEVLETRRISSRGRPVQEVNELACVGHYIYANVYMTDRILRIDKATGEVLAEIDASGLVPEGGRPSDGGAVLNGIAYSPESDTFFLTGKLWPTMFEVRFVPVPRER